MNKLIQWFKRNTVESFLGCALISSLLIMVLAIELNISYGKVNAWRETYFESFKYRDCKCGMSFK